MYRVFDRTYLEDQDTVPPIPPAARRLRPGERLRIRRTDRGLYETIERRPASAPLGAAALPRRPKTPRPGLGSLAGPAPAGGGERGYVVLRREEVPYRLRLRAEAALLLARDALLRGREPGLFYYRFARVGERTDFTQADILGVARPWSFEVGVRIDGATRPADVAETVYHEAAHLAGLPEAECERLARDLVLQGL